MSLTVQTNSLQAWMLAARPKTLSGAAVPVMIGLSAAYSDGNVQIVPAILCLLFAFLMQIDANFINDYYDFKKGIDCETRLGPQRACAEGWITLPAMWKGIIITTLLSCVCGLPLVYYGGWNMIFIGLLCVVFCFLYTTFMSGLGLGDILVLAFFGLVPVCTTYYIQCAAVPLSVWVLSVACGLVVDCLLIVNNYRDRENDKACGKNTLIVKIGGDAAEKLYLWMGFMGVLLCQVMWVDHKPFAALLPLCYLVPHFMTWKRMKIIRCGKALNEVLGMTARNILLFGILLSIGLII